MRFQLLSTTQRIKSVGPTARESQDNQRRMFPVEPSCEPQEPELCSR
ncbi:hypothetical protein PROFUN_06347 [Planoprotostelium fungivorum]|uniref:Uncharacterized protein n=1 Tax=Planoprotostelium fungivorum TaxID=1890364 RepID=A0A2P6NP75_9EUKA|nr:hypothetical protein PROFUN_06347 [Planoprotostelium fungivorum]